MFYWKFLRAGAVSPFTGFAWEPGRWVAADSSAQCRSGFHACRVSDLPYWLNAELWRIELADPVAVGTHKVVSPRARVTTQVAGWDQLAAGAFARACATRVLGHAVDELSQCGLEDMAGRLAGAGAAFQPAEWTAVAGRCADAADARGAWHARKLCGYVQDAAATTGRYPAAFAAYLAARAASHRSSATLADRYLDERDWQAQWLAGNIALG